MRSASTTASHRPLTWTTGLGEMRWESSPLSWNTPGCSSCRVRTSPHPVTFLEPERKCLNILHLCKLDVQRHWGWIRKWECLGSWTASMPWLVFSYLVSRFMTQNFPFSAAFSWIKEKLVWHWVRTATVSCRGLKVHLNWQCLYYLLNATLLKDLRRLLRRSLLRSSAKLTYIPAISSFHLKNDSEIHFINLIYKRLSPRYCFLLQPLVTYHETQQCFF